jgi:hypothetical protein
LFQKKNFGKQRGLDFCMATARGTLGISEIIP